MWHVLGITDFRIQRARDRLSSLKLSKCNLFGIVSIVASTNYYLHCCVQLPYSYKVFFQVCILLELIVYYYVYF